MRITCLHGYFKFVEERVGEISTFSSLTGFEFVRVEDYFTFAALEDAPKYSLPNGTFLGAATKVAYEGKPWTIMRANGIVYDFVKNKVVPVASVTNVISVQSGGNFYTAGGMILPGSVRKDGSRVTDYAAFYSSMGFKYSEIDNE